MSIYFTNQDLERKCKIQSFLHNTNNEIEAVSGIEFSTQKPGITLRIVNYNVFGRWSGVTGYEGQDVRLQHIPEAIKKHPMLGGHPDGVDVITVDEAWCPNKQILSGPVMCGKNKSRDLLTAAMINNGWIYHTNVVDYPGVFVGTKPANGGGIIFSKWPIEATSQYIFTNASGQDKQAAKGVIYARVIKEHNGIKQAFNIFGTHLQAWSTPEGAKTREKQLNEIYNNFLPNINIPTDGSEVVIFQGDMNTDYVLYPDEVENMKKILHAELPPFTPDSVLYTSNPSTNYLVGKDGAADSNGCLSEYRKQIDRGDTSRPMHICKSLAYNKKLLNNRFVDRETGLIKIQNKPCRAYCPCCPHEMLDYILYSTETKYLQPTKAEIQIIPLKSITPLSHKWGWCDGAECVVRTKENPSNLTGSDLSDHYPIVATFEFQPIKNNFSAIDGCKNDNDCKFSIGRCYCSGPTCTLNNEIKDGTKLGKSNRINSNCYFRTSQDGLCFCRPGNK